MNKRVFFIVNAYGYVSRHTGVATCPAEREREKEMYLFVIIKKMYLFAIIYTVVFNV